MKAIVSVNGTVATVLPANRGDSRDIVRALLDAAANPRQVKTVTTSDGLGWMVPAHVADKAGLTSKPKRRSTRRKKASDDDSAVTASN